MNLNHHLGVKSDFSIGESLLQIDRLVDKAKELGYESVALMDTMSVHGMVNFTNCCKKVGIKPIIGCHVRVYKDPQYRVPPKASGEAVKPNPFYVLKVYVVDERGIKSLMKLLSIGNSAENFYYHSRVGFDDVCELEGVAISTGDMNGLFHQENYVEILNNLIGIFGDKMFVELVPINTPLFDTLNARAIEATKITGVKTLVTYPSFYENDGDASSLNVLNKITTQGKMDEGWRPKQFIQDFYLSKPDAILDRVKAAMARGREFDGKTDAAAWAKGVKNIEILADLCTYQFKKLEPCLPVMAENEFLTLGKKCIEGWSSRFARPVLGYLPSAELMPVYKQRLHYELSILKKMNFSGYFLLVEDLVMWAKNNEIIVGPGRGSVGGSLVAYLLGITDVDPIRFGLLFERFINPERQDLPDADLDFMSSKRHLIVEYLIEKYGKDHVAGVSNYSSLASASAIRDTGRVYGMSGLELMATKLVPKEHGQSFTLTEAAKLVPELDKFSVEHIEVWGHALKLEGVMRSFGQHAAGVIVSGEPLIERSVVETRSESACVNWDKRVVEDWGLIKMDILGLSTLDVLEIAKSYVKTRHGITIDYLKLPLEEADIMRSFARGDTTGVFQFESQGMKRLLRSLADSAAGLSFEDVTAATALYRPGPMDSGLMDDYIAIKQGHREPYYEHPNMKPALESTYSVIVYQEQVMKLSVDLAGFSGAEADNLRKAMGKKDKDKMAEMRDKWIAGCLTKSGMEDYEAGVLFDKIEAFAGYGFNRSHAVEYSIISYWTMWVRVRYPAEYFAASMSIVKEEKLFGLVTDARQFGIEVLPPDVNLSTDKYTIPDDKHILAPFSSIKGCSENTALRIVELRNREGGKFTDEAHFRAVCLTTGSKVNTKVVENLNKVGGLVSVQTGALPARDFARRKDQVELMPGLIIDAVKADRITDVTEKFLRTKIILLANELQTCKDCSLARVDVPAIASDKKPTVENAHPSPRMGKQIKFMVISDCPSWQEEKAGKMLEGDAGTVVKNAIKAAGLMIGDGYYTSLVKAKKSDKMLSNEQINACTKYLDREIALIKPAIIVALGSATIRKLLPGLKGGTAELAGKVVFDSKLDASIVCGINPQQVHFSPEKEEVVNTIFEKVAEILI